MELSCILVAKSIIRLAKNIEHTNEHVDVSGFVELWEWQAFGFCRNLYCVESMHLWQNILLPCFIEITTFINTWKLNNMYKQCINSVKCKNIVRSNLYVLIFIHSTLQTNIGSILAAVNPYKKIPGLYDAEAVDVYSRHHLGELPPHIFAVANECYRCLWKRHDSQCVLIR